MNLKIKRCVLLTAFFILFAFVFTACTQQPEEPSSSEVSEPEPTAYPVTVRDVTVYEKPEKVLSLSPALTEMICDLGYQSQLAGVSNYCDYPVSVSELPHCGTNAAIDEKRISPLSFDLIVAQASFSDTDLRALQQTGAKIVILPHAKSFDQLKKIYTDLGLLLEGQLTGSDSAEQKYEAKYQEAKDLADRLSEEQKGKKAAYLRMLDLTVATGDTFEHQLLKLLGFENAAKAYGNWQYPQNRIQNFTPDFLFFDSSISAEELKNHEIYQKLEAVTAEKAYPVEGICLERQTFRMFDEMKKMLLIAYPELSE